ncbi:MAG: hypothetical protein J5891_03365 [Spirochaetales bacterium]|nr:hypothetical protein [Spirochaetales bacterium]
MTQNPIDERSFLEYLDRIAEGISGLEAWERNLASRLGDCSGTSAVVFNSNPLTIGGRYLAENASRRSKRVLLFVIQGKTDSGSHGNHEDTLIEFPFEKRFAMTKAALSDLENVLVIPSGPYLIGRDDYPAGYLSGSLGAAHAHGFLDGMAFCHICNALGIRNAYAGDEPRDEMSEIHLNTLRQLCAQNGIVLKVAERKRIGDKYISSSMVRKALAAGDMETVGNLVPAEVLPFLAGHSA